ncbi:DUF5680 domain-containing protein [Paenibacillus sp. sgz500958]|uniref:DUF5680 domain-containing protein n=1 Tax=Paenibacillus sp. sgz500958 TaxID=3242475 RepID=UPI0036D3AA15
MENTAVSEIDFLIEAKRATYAGKGPEFMSSRPSSHDLVYSKGNLKYIDTYLGSEQFAGEEALWENDLPSWAMNYAGRVLAEGFNGDFLKEALYQVPQDKPFRGPAFYENGAYTYACTVDGDFSWFSGYEEIWLNGSRIYECRFHGGRIK